MSDRTIPLSVFELQEIPISIHIVFFKSFQMHKSSKHFKLQYLVKRKYLRLNLKYNLSSLGLKGSIVFRDKTH
jgi:hypothetical protein